MNYAMHMHTYLHNNNMYELYHFHHHDAYTYAENKI